MEFINKKNPMDDFIFESREDALAFNDVTKYDINAFTEKYLEYVNYNYNNLENNKKLIREHLRPTQLRDEEEGDENKGWYDLLVDYLNTKEKENNEEKKSVNNAMKHLEDANKMLDKKKVGTSNINNTSENITDIDKFTNEYLNYVKNNQKHLQSQNEKDNEEKTSVNQAMKHLEDAQQKLNLITTIIKDTRQNIHKKLVGTLQGIIRSLIYMNNSNPLIQKKIEAHDVLAQAVLEQYYNEHEATNKGGKNKRVIKTKKRKTNKKIIKKSRKTNKYKY